MSKAPRNSGQPRHTRVAWAGFAAGLMIVTLIGLRPLGWISTGTDCHGGKDGKDQELVVATGAEVGAGGIRRRLIKEWNSDPKKNIKARLVEISESTDEQRAEMVAAAQSGRCVYDVLLLDVAWTEEFARNGYIVPIPAEALAGREFLPNSLETGKFENEQYAVPFAADAPLLYVRNDGKNPPPPPRTVPDLLSSARNRGYAAQFSDYEGGTINLMEAILSGESTGTGGAEWIMDALKDSGKVLGTLEKWHDVATASNGDLREESSLQAFRSGYVGYMRNWPFAYRRLVMDPSMRNDQGGLKFDLQAFPGVGILGGVNLAITRNSPHKKAAAELIGALTSPDAQRLLFACGGYAPVLESVYRDYAQVTGGAKTCGELLDGETGEGDRSAEPESEITTGQLRDFAEAVHQAVDRAVVRPKSAYYSTFSEVFRSCLLPVVLGSAVPPDFAEFADALRDAMDGKRHSGDHCPAPPET